MAVVAYVHRVATSPYVVERSIDIDAPLAAVWAAVSDPASYGRWSPEATGARYRGELPLRVGDRFTGHSRVWVPWTAACTVVRVEPERAFAFDASVAGVTVSRWTYEVRPVDGDRGGDLGHTAPTTVVQRWEDLRRGLTGRAIRPAGVFVGRGVDAATRNAVTMTETLRRLKADLEEQAASAP